MKTVIFSYKGAPLERVQVAEKLSEELGAEIFAGGTDTIRNLVDICDAFADDLLILEDDVALCENFREYSETIISKYPDAVINFHFNTFPKGDVVETVHFGDVSLKVFRARGSSYIWNQCFYIPNKMRADVIAAEEQFRLVYPYYVRTQQQDVFMAFVLRDTEFLAVYPSLVTHLDFMSTIKNSRGCPTIFPM